MTTTVYASVIEVNHSCGCFILQAGGSKFWNTAKSKCNLKTCLSINPCLLWVFRWSQVSYVWGLNVFIPLWMAPPLFFLPLFRNQYWYQVWGWRGAGGGHFFNRPARLSNTFRHIPMEPILLSLGIASLWSPFPFFAKELLCYCQFCKVFLRAWGRSFSFSLILLFHFLLCTWQAGPKGILKDQLFQAGGGLCRFHISLLLRKENPKVGEEELCDSFSISCNRPSLRQSTLLDSHRAAWLDVI